MKKRIDLERLSPPGRSPQGCVYWFGFLFCVQIFLSFWFFEKATNAWSLLYIENNGVRVFSGVKMAPFFSLVEGVFPVLPWFWVAMGVQVVGNYLYFRKGAMPIYVMKRLPDPWELHRRCWSVPALCAAGATGGCVVLTGFYFIIYLLFTPAECLPW